jgi:hypothetical protein
MDITKMTDRRKVDMKTPENDYDGWVDALFMYHINVGEHSTDYGEAIIRLLPILEDYAARGDEETYERAYKEALVRAREEFGENEY